MWCLPYHFLLFLSITGHHNCNSLLVTHLMQSPSALWHSLLYSLEFPVNVSSLRLPHLGLYKFQRWLCNLPHQVIVITSIIIMASKEKPLFIPMHACNWVIDVTPAGSFGHIHTI